jgi:hypothetical protein
VSGTRAIVIQKKTGRPVQFEITEQTKGYGRSLDRCGRTSWRRLSLSQLHLCRASDAYSPVRQTGLTLDLLAWRRPCEIRHAFAAAHEANIPRTAGSENFTLHVWSILEIISRGPRDFFSVPARFQPMARCADQAPAGYGVAARWREGGTQAWLKCAPTLQGSLRGCTPDVSQNNTNRRS